MDRKIAARMATTILKGPEDNSGIPHKPLGQLYQDVLTSHHRNKLAVIDIKSGEYYTYGDLLELCQSMASNLLGLGVKKDYIMAIISENSHKMCVVYLAALCLLTPLHLINPKFTQYELRHILGLSQPRIIFCSKKSLSKLMAIRDELDFLQTIVFLDDDDGCDERFVLYKNLIKRSRNSFHTKEDVNPETQTAIICNSSGTTGLPKGAMITHDGLRMHFVLSQDPIIGLTPNEYTPIVLPLSNVGCVSIMNWVLYTGSTMLVMDHFDPETFLQTVEKYKVQRLFLVPALVNFLLNSPLTEQFDLSSLIQVSSAGSTIAERELESLKIKLNLKCVFQAYGLTETSGTVTIAPRSEFFPLGSCGKVTTGCQLKIVDIDTQQTLGSYQSGEICVKGYCMKGYVNHVAKTEEIFDSEDFIRTGDLGYYDDQGYVFINGRLKEIIKYKSCQVSPAEVESVLTKHPLIKDAAVVPKSHPRFGEVAVGFIVKEDGAELIEEEIGLYLKKMVCAEKWLHGGVRFVDAIPRNAMGKILRWQLQKML